MNRFAMLSAGTVLLAFALPPLAEGADWPGAATPISPTDVNASLGLSGRPMAVDATGAVHLMYQNSFDGDIFELVYLHRNEAGTWQTPLVVTEPGISGRNSAGALDAAGNLHVIWETLNGDGGDISYRVRGVDGVWSTPAQIAPAPSFSRSAVIAVDALNRAHAVWVDGRFGTQEILHAQKNGETDPWSTPRVISVGGVTPDDPNLITDGFGGIHVVWSDRGATPATEGSYDIVHLHVKPESPDEISPVRLVDHTGVALRPFLEAAPDGSLHLVWLDNRIPGPGDPLEIFYKRLLPGIGWGKDKRFTYDGKDHGRPSIVSGENSSLHVVWEDYRGGNPEIYYREITDAFGWDRAVRITSNPSSSQAPGLAYLPGGGLLLAWSDAEGAGVFRIFVREGLAQTAAKGSKQPR